MKELKVRSRKAVRKILLEYLMAYKQYASQLEEDVWDRKEWAKYVLSNLKE